MNRYPLISLSILSMLLAFAGCTLESSTLLPSETSGAEEKISVLPPGYIAFFDGKDTVAAPYEISDGMVVVAGDIVLGKASVLLGRKDANPKALGKATGNILVSAMPGQANSWPSGRIPYVIETDAARKSTILVAIKEWNEKAPVIWVPRTTQDADYVAFIDDATVTNSNMGKVGNKQFIKFAPNKTVRAALHEMGHAAGLFHEQQRSDRASNIDISFSSQSVSANNDNFTQMGTAVGAYDHNSIMHYSPGKFYFIWNSGCSCWNSTTNVTADAVTMGNQAGKPVIAPANTLSPGDLLALRGIYMNALPYDAATSQSLTTGLAWPVVRPFKSGGLYFILHYNPATGQFRTYPFSPSQGMINNPIETGTWATGWSNIEFYTIGAQTYALFFNRTDGSVSFYTMNANGKLGAVVETQTWLTKWDIIRIYKPSETEQRFIFLYAKSTGLARIFALKANGALDFARKTTEMNLSGYEDFQVMEDVKTDLVTTNGTVSFPSAYLLFHDEHNSSQILQVLTKTGGVGLWVTTAGVGAGFTQVNVYARRNRSEAMYYNKSNGKLLICDIRPVFTGNDANPPFTSAGLVAIRSHTTGANFQVYNFNINPWITLTDPKGAERLFMFDPGLKRFWNSNLVPFPSI